VDGQEAFAVLDDPPTPDHAGRQILKSFWPDCLSGIIPAAISALHRACWSLDPPDLGEKLADLLVYVPTILLGHAFSGSMFFRASISIYPFRLRLSFGN
jgi:hypothetical protein